MIRLRKINISNYRSCLKTNLLLPKDLICLIGVNGAGKTTLLNSILLLKKIRDSRRLFERASNSKSSPPATLNIDLDYLGSTIRIKCDLYFETDDKNNDEVIDATIKANFLSLTGKKNWIKIPIELFHYNIDILQGQLVRRFYKNGIPTTKELDIISNIQQFFKKTSYYSASQFSDPSNCPISFELEESNRFRQSRFYNYSHEKFLSELFLTYKNNNKLFKKFLSTINEEGIVSFPKVRPVRLE